MAPKHVPLLAQEQSAPPKVSSQTHWQPSTVFPYAMPLPLQWAAALHFAAPQGLVSTRSSVFVPARADLNVVDRVALRRRERVDDGFCAVATALVPILVL